MQLAKIINTCTHERVAEAAVASIGEAFFREIDSLAQAREMNAGAYVSSLVLRFAWRASDGDHRALARAMRGAQTPMLAGLRFILEVMINEGDRFRAGRRCSGPGASLHAAA